MTDRMGDIRGSPSTLCKMRVWIEQDFDYATVIDCARFRDARAEYLAMHNPPLLWVEWVRYDREMTRPAGAQTEAA